MEIRGSKVLVTGGAGFIGSHLAGVLLERGNQVLVVDDFSSGSQANLAPFRGDARLEVVRADVCDADALMPLFRGIDFAFLLATRNVRLSLRQPTQVHEVNTTGTLNVLKAAAAAGVSRFLYCSSSEVNGTADQVPMPEDYHYRPETVYGASKLAGEYYAQVFFRAGWVPTVIARPHNNYGPRAHYAGHNAEVIPRFILRALAGLAPVIYGDGRQTRDFTYVRDTAQLLVALLECDQAEGQTVNVCREEELSVRDLALIILELTGLELAPVFRAARPSDVQRLYGSNARLARLLGATPPTGIREGLRMTIDWYRTHVALTPGLLAELDQA